MTGKQLIALSLALFFIIQSNAPAIVSNRDWTVVSLDRGISLRYPSSWWPSSISKERVDIMSSKGGAEGVRIRHGQAEIIAAIVHVASKTSLDQLISQSVRDQILVSQDNLAASARNGCGYLEKVVSLDELGPGFFVVNTAYFCELDKVGLVVTLRNWQGDKRQAEYEGIVLRLVRSVRRQY